MTDPAKKPAFYIVDGNNYLYRAFYAIPELSNSKGFPTNAIYGFTTMLIRLLKEHEPYCIAVAFDLKGPTFRHEAFDGYKATRKATPDALIPQIRFVKEVVRGFSIPVLEQEGIEADDIIGTLAHRCAGEEMQVVIVSGDKDMMQLISENVSMIDTMKDKTYDVEAVREKFGVGPDKVVDILGLTGDLSDNIPGVPGIGPKNALRLIEEFGSLEAVLQNIDKVKNGRAKAALEQFSDQARMSRDLATIRTNADFFFDLDACRYTGPDREALKTLFKEFEFSSLLQELRIRETALEGEYRLVGAAGDLEALAGELRKIKELAIDVILEGEGAMKAAPVGIALCAERGRSAYVPLPSGVTEGVPLERVRSLLGPVLADGGVAKYGHDLKGALLALGGAGIDLAGLKCDTMVAAYLLNPSRHGFELSDVAREFLGHEVTAAKEIAGSGAKAVPMGAIPLETMRPYACRRADAVFALEPVLCAQVQTGGLGDLFNEVEMPLVAVLAAMEKKGVLLDTAILKDMSRETAQLLSMSEEKIYRLAGERFNINSPKQLQGILFDKLKLAKGRKTKDGYSTDVEVLASLAKTHELPAEILAYRSLMKLKTTYIDALPQMVNPATGRVHTSFNQTATATGRLSSSNPNLQNIPIRTLEGKRIRQTFIAPEGWLLVSADYSQIELRVLAHLSQDETLIRAFESGEDIHSRTASDVFGVFPEMVNADMRRQAKVINFGILYGMSPFGLAKELGVNQKLAQTYIEGYFAKYAAVRAYLDEILACARKNGYVETLLSRRRYIPEIKSPNNAVRQFAERTAINAPIQGTAADLIKVAMVNISGIFARRKLRTAMILQVHDELVFETPAEEREEVMTIVKKEMEDVIRLRVPLRVDIASGRNWDEAH